MPSFSYQLIPGDTNETLTDEYADFVFLDGGHAVSTIKHDLAATASSKVILLDDYYVGMSTEEFGCNSVIGETTHLILPISDPVSGGGRVHFAVIGPLDILETLRDRFPGARLVSYSEA